MSNTRQYPQYQSPFSTTYSLAYVSPYKYVSPHKKQQRETEFKKIGQATLRSNNEDKAWREKVLQEKKVEKKQVEKMQVEKTQVEKTQVEKKQMDKKPIEKKVTEQNHHKEQKKTQSEIKPVQTNFNQKFFLSRFNQFRKIQGLNEVSMEGHCHGFTLRWWDALRKGKVSDYYGIQKFLITCSENELVEKKQEITAFWDKLHRAQHPDHYNQKLSQRDIEYILDDVRRVERSDSRLTDLALGRKCVDLKESQLMVLRAHTKHKHTIGICRSNTHYLLHDANFKSGEHRVFSNVGELVAAAVHCLYTNFDLQVPALKSLEIDIVKDVAQKEAVPSFLSATKNVNLTFFRKPSVSQFKSTPVPQPVSGLKPT